MSTENEKNLLGDIIHINIIIDQRASAGAFGQRSRKKRQEEKRKIFFLRSIFIHLNADWL